MPAKAKNGNPKCAALTAANKKCKNHTVARGKYCASHKGWRPNAQQKKILKK